ncbi:MAG: phosphoribosylglycinamide formyltransferase [Desulfohalobiaceae bacterium]
MTLKLGVLLSGSGSNLQAVMDRIDQGALQAEIGLVLSDNDQAYGLTRAKAGDLPTRTIWPGNYTTRLEHDLALVQALKESQVEVVLLAGYMRLVSKEFVQAFPGGVLNIHPGLLPAFKGLQAQKQAAEYGVKLAGASVHFVDEHLDHGPLIIQACLPVHQGEDGPSLAQRILRLEHRIYPQAVQWLAESRLDIKGRHVYLQDVSKQQADIQDLGPCLINPGLEEGF